MSTILGKLFYTLGLDDSPFQADLKRVADNIKSLSTSGNNSVSLTYSDVTSALNSVTQLKNTLDTLKGTCELSISGVPKDITANGTINFDTSTLKTQVEAALQGISISGVQIDTSAVKSQLQQQIWNINVTSDPSNIQKIISRIRQLLGVNKITVYVSPDMRKKDIDNIKRQLERELKNLNLAGVKVSIDRTKLQKQLDNMHLTATVDIKVNQTSAAQAVQNAVNKQANLATNTGNSADNTSRLVTQTERHNKALTDQLGVRRSINDQMSRNTQLATMLGNAFGNVFAAYQIKNFLENLIQIGGEIQKQRLALGHIIDNISNANALFEQMKQLAVKSPFGLLDLMQNARQLSAFGVEYNQLYDTMKRLSDMAAGLGIQFSRLALAYGETKERGFLDGKLVRQFSYMGLPVLQKVAEYYTQIDKLQNGSVVTAAQVRSMVSDKAVSFEDVDAVIKKMTEEGGQFYNMQEVMAESVSGKWKNLKDAIDIMYSDIVEGNSAILKAPAQILTTLTRNYDALAAVLAAVALRMVGIRGTMALNNTIVARHTQALWLNKKAMQDVTIAAIKKNGTFASMNAMERKQIMNLNQLSVAQTKQLVRTQQLTKGDVERLIMMKRLSQEQIEYLMRCKLITKSEVDAAMGMTRMGIAARQLGTALKSIFSGWNLAFLAMTVGFELYSWFSNTREKAKEFAEGVQQAADDFKKATAQIASEVNGLTFENMSFGERETEIKSMVEYIKDNVPDAERKLNDIFKKGDDGKFVKSTKEIYDALKLVVNEMEELSMTDLSEWEKSARNAFSQSNILGNVQDFMKAKSDIIAQINQILGNMKAVDRDAIINNFKSQYKDALMEAFNLDNEADLKKKSQDQLLNVIASNDNLFNAFINANKDNFKTLTTGVKDYKGMLMNEYNDLLVSVAKSMLLLKRQIEGKEGKLDWTKSENQEKWGQAVKLTVETEYKDKTSEEQRMIRQLMTNPVILSQLDTQTGNVDAAAKKILSNDVIRKNVYLNIISMYDGAVTQDPFADFRKGLTGNVNTDKTAAGDYEMIVKQATAATEALRATKKASNLMKSVSQQNGKWTSKLSFGASTKEAVEEAEAFAGQLNTLEGNLQAAKDAAEKYGYDWNKIMADINKKMDKKESGSTSKKDALAESIKVRFDEVKKTWNEYQKWLKEVGENEAAKKMNDLGLMQGFNIEDFLDPDAYKKKVKALIAELQKDKKALASSAERQKLLTSLQVEIGEIEFKGVQKASQELAKNIQEEINNAMKQWDVYKSWFGVTGDKELSLSVAMNIKPLETEESKYFYADLEKKLEAEVKKGKINELDLGNLLNFENKTASAEMLFTKAGMQEYFSLWQKVKELMVSGGFELAKDMANVLKNTDDYETKISAIRNNLVEQIKRINSNYDGKTKQMLIDEETRQAQEKINKLTIESMKKTMNWDMLFNNANGLSKETLDVLHNKLQILIDDMSKLSNPDVQSIKTLTDMLDKIKGLQAERGNVFSNITKSFKNMSSAYEKLDILNSNKSRVGISDLYKQYKEAKVGSEDYSRIMKTQVTVYTEKGTMEIMKFEEYLKLLTKAEADAANQNNNFAKSMKKLGKDISSISNIAKSALTPILGSLGGGGYFGDVANSVLGTLDTVGSAIDKIDFSKPLSLDSIQGYTDIASSFVSLSQSINNANAAAFERELKNLESRSQNLVSIFEMLAEEIKESLGMAGIGELESSTNQLVNNYQKAIESIISTAKDKMAVRYKNDAGYTRHSYGYYLWKGDDRANLRYSALSKAAEDINKKFGTNIQSTNDFFSLTKEQMEYFITTYPTLISQNSDFYDAIMALYTYLKKVDEVNLADNFFGGNDTEFLNNWVSLVQDMSKTADDFCDDFENSLSDAIIKSMVNTEFKEQIQALREKMNAYAQDGLSIEEADDLRADAEALSKALAERRKMYEEMGLIKNTDDSSTASSSIKGVTEETADILASYINGMRLDLSIQRLAVEQIRDLVGTDGSRSLNAIAEAQCNHLSNIASYTSRTADAVEALQSHFVDVTNGVKSISIQ